MTSPDFDAVYAEHYPMVRQLCLGYVNGDGAAADDLAQDCFVRVWRGLPKYRGEASAKTWVYRIAVNTCLQDVRRRSRRPRVTAVPEEAHLTTTEPDRDPRLDRLFAAIATLNQLDRLIYLLTLEGVPNAEIAEVTGLSAGALRVRLHRANHKLRKRLTDA